MTNEDIQRALEAFEADMKECHCECDMPEYVDTIRQALQAKEQDVIDVNDKNILKELSNIGINDTFDIAVALIKIREKYPNGIIIKDGE